MHMETPSATGLLFMYLQSLVEYIYKFMKILHVKLDVLKILRIIKYFVLIFIHFLKSKKTKRKKLQLMFVDSKMKNLLVIR